MGGQDSGVTSHVAVEGLIKASGGPHRWGHHGTIQERKAQTGESRAI